MFQSTPGQLRVKILTWNLGDNHLTEDLWQQEIKKSWEIITRRDFDILCVCLQEDSRGKYGKFGDAVGDLLQDEFIMDSHSVEGPPEITKQSFSVRAFLYIRTSRGSGYPSQSYKTTKAEVCLKRVGFCSKGSAGISIVSPLPNRQYLQFTLMSSHLPVDNSTPDLGYDARLKAVQTTLREVYDKLEDTRNPNRIAFWGGDLNFRDNTPVTSKGPPFADQLDYAFSTHKPTYFRQFSEPDVAFPPTCKLVTCDKISCPPCRKNSNNVFDPTCYDTNGGGGKVSTREPSHCDRILFRADGGISAEVVEYKSWGSSDIIDHSDHSIVYATFIIHF
jgi:hypothetical protein